MLVLQNDSKNIDGNFLEWCTAVLNSLCSCDEPVFLAFVEEPLKNELGRKVSGAYVKFNNEGIPVSIMFIDDVCDEMKVLEAIIHEYAHHLSQEGHDGKLFRLFYEFLYKEGMQIMLPEEKIKERITEYEKRLVEFLNSETSNLFQNHLVALDRDIVALSLLYETLEQTPPSDVIDVIDKLKVKCQKL